MIFTDSCLVVQTFKIGLIIIKFIIGSFEDFLTAFFEATKIFKRFNDYSDRDQSNFKIFIEVIIRKKLPVMGSQTCQMQIFPFVIHKVKIR